jgi:hypothetical protein
VVEEVVLGAITEMDFLWAWGFSWGFLGGWEVSTEVWGASSEVWGALSVKINFAVPDTTVGLGSEDEDILDE